MVFRLGLMRTPERMQPDAHIGMWVQQPLEVWKLGKSQKLRPPRARHQNAGVIEQEDAHHTSYRPYMPAAYASPVRVQHEQRVDFALHRCSACTGQSGPHGMGKCRTRAVMSACQQASPFGEEVHSRRPHCAPLATTGCTTAKPSQVHRHRRGAVLGTRARRACWAEGLRRPEAQLDVQRALLKPFRVKTVIECIASLWEPANPEALGLFVPEGRGEVA